MATYDLISLPLGGSTGFYAAGAAGFGGPQLAVQIPSIPDAVALSIDDSSQVPSCLVYLNGEGIGLPLGRNRIIRRRCHSLRVAPLLPSTFPSAALSLPSGSTGSGSVAPGNLVLRAWRELPTHAEEWAVGPMASVEQSIVTLNGAGAADVTLGFARCPGAQSVTAWASNNNTANAAAATLSLYTVRPESNGQAVPTTLRLGTQLGTATLPAAADAGRRVEVSIYFPGVYEVAWVLTLPATVGSYTAATGCEITYA